MGAWDVGPLDNDAAVDFLSEWQETEDYDHLDELLTEILDLGGAYIESDLGQAVVAAGYIVAAVVNENQGSVFEDDEESEDWIMVLPEPEVALLTKLVKSLRRILKPESEVREVWEETDDFDSWKASVAEIISELT